MKYEHSIERSTAHLRQALPLMSRQAAALHPVSYAVWYEYVAHENRSLRDAVDRHLSRHGQLDESSTHAIFREHVAEIDPHIAQRVTEGFQRILAGMSESAAQTGDQAATYGSSLSALFERLERGESGVALDEVREGTREMLAAVARLQQRLAESQLEIDSLREEVKRARHDSLIDSLTGLANRRGFDQRLSACLAESGLGDARSGPALLVVDIDYFKRINDNYGHGFGDQVLRAVAQVLKGSATEPAFPARIGGEEFALLMPSTPLAPALAMAEHVRSAIADSRIQRNGTTLEKVTVALGVAAYEAGESPMDFIERADRALYASKSGGRNRVSVAE